MPQTNEELLEVLIEKKRIIDSIKTLYPEGNIHNPPKTIEEIKAFLYPANDTQNTEIQEVLNTCISHFIADLYDCIDSKLATLQADFESVEKTS